MINMEKIPLIIGTILIFTIGIITCITMAGLGTTFLLFPFYGIYLIIDNIEIIFSDMKWWQIAIAIVTVPAIIWLSISTGMMFWGYIIDAVVKIKKAYKK